MLRYDENFKISKVIDVTAYWIFCELTYITGKKFTIGCVYIPPDTKYNIMLTQRFEMLENFEINEAIIGGDFNARTGNLTASPWHPNPDLAQHRMSRDSHVCSRGKLFIDGIVNSNLALLNGHCRSDAVGE